jgi:hypothetical protein
MAQMDREDEILYSRGLMDGIRLCRWIERIGCGEEILKWKVKKEKIKTITEVLNKCWKLVILQLKVIRLPFH